jgi:HD-like signal output (HDOD) protein
MNSPSPDLRPIVTSEIVAVANELGASGAGPGAAKLVALLYDDSVDAAAIVRVLQAEPALAARLLKVANSAYYRRGGNIGTFEQAIVVLGLSGVRGIAAVACMDRISVPTVGNLLDANRFRSHSTAVAAAAQSLSQRARAGVDAEAFMAGLIHDIGLVILARLRPGAVATLAALNLDETAILQAEVDLLGIDQASASALVAEAWHLPAWLCLALRSHHTPETRGRIVGTAALPALLALAGRCAAEAGFRLWAPPSGIPHFASTDHLGLDDDVCREVVAGLPEAVVRLTSH